jgi:RND family efflux transporter MFP subunit
VEAASVTRAPIALERTFTGTLEAHAEFLVAPKVSGRVEEVAVDLADRVTRGQVVARLDDAEYQQAVAQAEADLAVARANLAEARSLLGIAERELERVEQLRARGVTSESERDVAKAEELAARAHVDVTRAQVARAAAALESTRIRLGYTRVEAGWSGGSDQRTVAERYVDEGETVSANTPLLRIVELDPLTAVFHVTEVHYGLLRPGQGALLRTDAYPGRTFAGRIDRIAPVFQASTRQARVELRVENRERLLKPGMFVRATVTLDRVDDALVVPEQALTLRDGATGVFQVAPDGATVAWVPVTVGIRQGDRVQVAAPEVSGRVVVLGHQLVDDGSRVTVAGPGEVLP